MGRGPAGTVTSRPEGGASAGGASEPRPLRLFVAVDVPDDVRDALAAQVAPLRSEVPGAKWTAPENWHVTLKFLGSVPPPKLDGVLTALSEAALEHTAFRARLGGLGAFPSSRKARVLWAGVEDRHGELAGVARSVDRALAAEFPAEERPFAAHLTLARLKEQARLPDGLLDPQVTSRPFRVGSIRLYRSFLQRPAARYEVLREFRLSD